MGEGIGSSLQVASREQPDDSTERDIVGPDSTTEAAHSRSERSQLDAGRRRFTWAAVIAMAVTAVPFTWILWSDWGPLNPLRPSVYQDNFYDLQARAMFHGRLSLPNGSLGIEGFVHAGRTYTYFGLFPSIIRMPVLLVTSSLDGKLTASSMLLAWLLTGLFTALLLWRVRFFVRGDVAMGRAEASVYGVLVATIMGGTIWMLLASVPFVFNEDLCWSICLTVASIFMLLGVIERPSWGRVVASGVLITCANLDRATTGWACVVGAILIAGWFLIGKGGDENRRWFLPVLAAGLIPLLIGCVVNYAKFGQPFGVSNFDQVWTQVNAYRRHFLKVEGGEEGTVFVPTNVATYFRPNGLSLSNVFPYVTLPTAPPTGLSGVLFDRLYRTASLPASTPLLFLLGIWGLITAFRPKPVGHVARTRLLLLAAGSAGAALMLWGYIAPRYIGDFVPLLTLACAVAVADILRRLEGWRRSWRLGAVTAITLLALFSIVANIGMAVVPNEEWNTTQALNYTEAVHSISDVTGHPLQANVHRGNSLPTWGPAGQLYVIGDCNGLYISDGENYSTVPNEEYQRTTWLPVQLGGAFQHTFRLAVRTPTSRGTQSVAVLRAGPTVFEVSATPTYPGRVLLTFGLYGGGPTRREVATVSTGTTHSVSVTTDPIEHHFTVSFDGTVIVGSATLPSGAKAHVIAAGPSKDLQVSHLPTPQPSLCESLVH